MSLTALIVLLVYFAGLILGLFYQPIFALFSYLWIFYNDPSTNWWGADVPDLRYSLVAAVVALLAVLLRSERVEPWISSGAAKLLLCYAAWTWVQTPWAVNVDLHLEGAVLFTKYVILSYVVYRLTAEERNITWFLWAHVGGCFIFAWYGYTSEVTTRLETIGGPGVDDANLLSAHVLTGLVIASFLFIGSTGYKRWAAFATLPFILNVIILTQSRGGFIALIGAGFAAWYLSPQQYRKVVSIAGALGIVLLLMLSNEFFWDRVMSLIESEDLSSQETRLRILGPQFSMFLDHPLGAGHRGNELLSPQYMSPDLLSNSGLRSAHNTFMAALVDQGLPGALILLGLYGWGFRALRRLKKLDASGLPAHFGLLRAGLGSALASLFVSGLFLNLLKTEVQIWMISAVASLVVLSQRATTDSRAGARPAEATQLEGTSINA